jgi:hypothetical protein
MNSNPKSIMVGKTVVDAHKNTARSKHVNDRLRRHRKRVERLAWKTDVKSGVMASVLSRKA